MPHPSHIHHIGGVPRDLDQVHVHLHVTAAARRDLRVAAAQLGLTMSDLVAHWATSATAGMPVTTPVDTAEVSDGR